MLLSKMAHLYTSPLFAFLAVLVATAVSQPVNPAEAEDAHSKYSLHNRQQCQRLCWYTEVCLRYSYRTKTQTGADNPHNCVIHVTEGQGEELEEGWVEERASGDSLSESHGCKERPCGTDALCVPSAAPTNTHVCARVPDVNECSSSPCENGGSCQDQVNAYTCICEAGYTGDHCQTNINECSSSPCENGGSCQDQVNAYTCTCAAGYTGNNCETNINECSSSPCENGGSCQDQVNVYTCTCVAGYTGHNCETNIDECSSSPCENGGSCQDQVNAYTCTCDAGYTGNICETNINECSSNPCQNGGTCEDEVSGFTCNCVAGYTGPICSTNINECSPSPCQNGGSCQDQINAYTCTCAAGYTGDHCQTEIDECISSPCENGGSCQDQVNAYTCTCAAGYSGDQCQTEIHAVLNDGSVLLFRVTPGINQSAYDRFTAIGDNDDNTAELLQAVPAGCKTTNGSLPCDRHYRSRLLDQNPLSFQTIRVGLYKDGGKQAFFEFNATGADYMNWFHRERILTSSYTDITDNPTTTNGNYFSIEGDGGPGRRFFVNHNYGGCGEDAGWLAVVERSNSVCSWEGNPDGSYPSVFFMAGTSYGTWNDTGRTMADSLVISGRMDTS